MDEQKNVKKRIGFLSTWSDDRGRSNVTLNYVKMLANSNYDCYILKQGNNPILDEYKKFDVNIFEYSKYDVPKEVFKTWVETNKLDVVIFDEASQWNINEDELIKIANKCGCKTYGYLVLEKFKYEQTLPYTRVISPTISGIRFLRFNKVRKHTHIPYSIDLNEFTKEKRTLNNEHFTFFHPAGMGGYKERKNTQAVIEAFKLLAKERTDVNLVIASQKPIPESDHPQISIINKNLDRKELIDLYWNSDFTVLPSKWETIGIPILESLACWTPVITHDFMPMNEFIRTGINGYLVTPTFSKYDDISIPVCECNVISLKKIMETSLNPILHNILKNNSRKIIEELYDLEKNKKVLISFLDKELKGDE